ncbi:MAG: glycine C-acetyltransferase [bacterium]
MNSFLSFISEELNKLEREGLLRSMDCIETGCYPDISIENRRLINFCSNNYLSLNGHPYITKAMKEAIDAWGSSSGASRLIVGNLILFERAEKVLAEFKKKETALIFPSGYQANVTVISTLMQEGDEIFSDQLNHASIIDGCRMSKAKTSIYRHRDVNHLESLLKKSRSRKKLIVTDGVFSMDGDIAPLLEISEVAKKYDALVVVDDAHSTGVLGKEGRGTTEYFGIENENIMVLGTGGKALGVGGAFFCCPEKIRKYLINRGRGFIYTTGAVPAIPAGLMASVKVIKEEPQRRSRLSELSEYFHSSLKLNCLQTSEKPSHIIPLIIGDNDKTLMIAEFLKQGGVYAKAIRYPTVPKGTERIRFSLTAEHTKEDIDKTVEVIKVVKSRL